MKKTILTLISAFMAFSAGLAQNTDGIVAQPTHVVGKRIDASGEVAREFVSDFTYQEDGKLSRYSFPDFHINGYFTYTGDFLVKEYLVNTSTFHTNSDLVRYTYENDRVKTGLHCDYWDYCRDWEYTYYDDGRLERKDYRDDGNTEYHEHYLYDYENGGRTVIENYWTSWVLQGWLLRKKTTKEYDNSYRLLSTCTENYSVEGELTSSTLVNYTYTPEGEQEDAITLTLTDGEWVNTSIMRYVYESSHIAERLDGNWDTENGEWDFNQKITFEYSQDGRTYTVSFYKKVDGEWVWNIFAKQTILFGANLKAQQRMINHMAGDELSGNAYVNQIEFTLEYTEEPIYMDTEERTQLEAKVYPNPSSGIIRVESPTNDAVVRFYNLQGQLMIARPFDFSTEINTEGWPAGIYLWEIWNDNQKEAAGKWLKK